MNQHEAVLQIDARELGHIRYQNVLAVVGACYDEHVVGGQLHHVLHDPQMLAVLHVHLHADEVVQEVLVVRERRQVAGEPGIDAAHFGANLTGTTIDGIETTALTSATFNTVDAGEADGLGAVTIDNSSDLGRIRLSSVDGATATFDADLADGEELEVTTQATAGEEVTVDFSGGSFAGSSFVDFNGGAAETVSLDGLSGSELRVVIRSVTSGDDESYFWDDVSVTGQDSGVVRTITVSRPDPGFIWRIDPDTDDETLEALRRAGEELEDRLEGVSEEAAA